jgi:hypothetical protein
VNRERKLKFQEKIFSLYIDGVQVRNIFIPGTCPDTSGVVPLRIGARRILENLLAETSPRKTFNGLIDED